MNAPREQPKRPRYAARPPRSSPRVGPLAGRAHPTELFDVDGLLDDRETQIIVCCGSGGVGKTTTAAALGLRAAERGRTVVVLTIDPARRLAQSLGLTSSTTPRARSTWVPRSRPPVAGSTR